MAHIQIVGSKTWNNYYLMSRVLENIIVPGDVIITDEAKGVGEYAEYYAIINNINSITTDHDRHDLDTIVHLQDGSIKAIPAAVVKAKKKGIPIIQYTYSNSHIIQHSDKVVHCKRDKFDAYIGRGKDSVFHNPFKLKNEADRGLCLSRFTDYLVLHPELCKKALQLEGKTLGCWCRTPEGSELPQRLCHGDIYVWLCGYVKNPIPMVRKSL